MNYSICFSAKSDYFVETKALAEPAVRFYTKIYLEPFTVEETIEYTRSVFSTSPDTTATIAAWLHKKPSGTRTSLLSSASIYRPLRIRFSRDSSKRFGP